MQQPRLYLFMGYPGAGKTTVAQLIADTTGAAHIWADRARLEMFNRPTHSQAESSQLYAYLNEQTANLLNRGTSVIFDTNFNYRSDRDKLRAIAARHNATTVVIWMTTPLAMAKQRAVHDANLRNGYEVLMTDADFDALAAKLEPPAAAEQAIAIDGSDIDISTVKQQLGI